MQILITNDDGITAPGLQMLEQELSQIAEIVVVAPESERSAMSQAITVHNPIRVQKFDMQNAKHAWQISGTPTDCVKLAVEALLPKPPDVIVSGINRGPNLGTDVLYSGTVSAAMEGILYGIPSIAVSLDTWEDFSYQPAARFVCKLILSMQKNQYPPATLLNINVPALPDQEIGGYVITKMGNRQYKNVFEKRLDPRGRAYYWMGGNTIDCENDPDSDVAVVRDGKISVTPIHFDLTNHNILNILRKWEL